MEAIGRGEPVRDEDRFPTVRFHKCHACGQVYTGSLTGQDACPGCHAPSREAALPGGQIHGRVEGGHALFTITGTVYKIQDLEELRTRILSSVAQDVGSVAFAFENSSFLNSSTINLLVNTMRTLSVQGKPTFIITRDAEVLESLQMMDLDRVMRILPGLEEYKAALG